MSSDVGREFVFCLASLTICLLPSICNFPGQLFQVKTSVLLYFVEQDGFPEHKNSRQEIGKISASVSNLLEITYLCTHIIKVE